MSNASEFWNWYNHNGEKPSPDYHIYQKLTAAPYNRELEHIITFFSQMYDFSAANACAWKVVQDSFGQDASHFRDYFEPVFDAYAKRVRIDPSILWMPLYAILWDASRVGPSTGCHKSFIESIAPF